MNKKLVGVIIAAVVVLGLTAGCVEEEPAETPMPELTPTPMPTEETPTPPPAATPAAAAMVSCDMCHQREATVELAVHVEGGQSCMGSAIGPCHSAEKYGGETADVHTVHPAEVTCRQCHIQNEQLVIPETGTYSSCELCHGYPNPLDPSNGRLVEIHLERGRDCQVCHVGDISEVHKGVM